MSVFKWIRPGYKLVTAKLEWNVHVPFLQTVDGNGGAVESPLFSPQETPNRKWKLVMYDRSRQIGIINARHHNSAGELANSAEPALVKMSILNGKGRKVLQQMPPSNPTTYYVEFNVYKEDIIKSECQQPDGSLTFCWKIFTHVKQEPDSPADPPGFPIDCSGGLITHLEGLFDHMPSSDINFNIDGREFPAHKLILSARSQVFAAMFKNPNNEQSTNQIDIEDIEPEVFEQLLRFVYTGRVPLEKLETMAAGLFIAADKYLLGELKTKCENHLLRHMSPDNCVVLLFHCDLQNPTEPLKEAAKFFRRLPSQVMATDGWEKMEEENPRLLCQIQKFVFSKK